MTQSTKSLVLVLAVLCSSCDRGCHFAQQPKAATTNRTVEPRRLHVFERHSYEALLRLMAASRDPVTRSAASVLQNGRDAWVQPSERQGVAALLMSMGVAIPTKNTESEQERIWGITRAIGFLITIDDSFGKLRAGDHADLVGEAVNSAYLALLRGKDSNAAIMHVLDSHGFHAQSEARSTTEYYGAYLSDLAGYSYPRDDPYEAGLWKDMMSRLPRIGEDYPGYVESRDRLAGAMFQKLLMAERQRWGDIVPPPIWYFRNYEWERFNFDWDVAANSESGTRN